MLYGILILVHVDNINIIFILEELYCGQVNKGRLHYTSRARMKSFHYIDVIMTTMASQSTSLTVVYSTVYSDIDHKKHQSSASLAFVRGIHRDRWIPRTKASYAENVSIWWRHHVMSDFHWWKQQPYSYGTVCVGTWISNADSLFNSSPPSVAHMRQWTWSALVQIISCRLFGAKPLAKPMLCQLGP